jgi:hypothetical protein
MKRARVSRARHRCRSRGQALELADANPHPTSTPMIPPRDGRSTGSRRKRVATVAVLLPDATVSPMDYVLRAVPLRQLAARTHCLLLRAERPRRTRAALHLHRPTAVAGHHMDILAHPVTVADRGDGSASRRAMPRRPSSVAMSSHCSPRRTGSILGRGGSCLAVSPRGRTWQHLAAPGCDRRSQDGIAARLDSRNASMLSATRRSRRLVLCHRVGRRCGLCESTQRSAVTSCSSITRSGAR